MVHSDFKKSEDLRFKISKENGEQKDLNFQIKTIDCFHISKDNNRCVVNTDSHFLYSFKIGYKGDKGLYTLDLNSFRKAGSEFKYSEVSLSGSYLVAKATIKSESHPKSRLHVYRNPAEDHDGSPIDLFWSMRPEEFGLVSDFKNMSFITFDSKEANENTLMISNSQVVHLYTIGDMSVHIPEGLSSKQLNKIEILFEADKDAKYTGKSLVSSKNKKKKENFLSRWLGAKWMIWTAIGISILSVLLVLLLAGIHTLKPKGEENGDLYDFEGETNDNKQELVSGKNN